MAEPMTDSKRVRHQPIEAPPLSTAAAGAAADSTVVIVDDEPANVVLLERLLGAAGVGRVHAFTDPRQAFAHCSAELPDLVLLDLHMPGMDGFAFMDALRVLLPSGGFLPILVLSADVTFEVKTRALSSGAKDFLTKPFDRTEVLIRVANLLETRALYKRLEEHTSRMQEALNARIADERTAATQQERRVRQALAPGALTMVFQAVADLSTGDVVGVEALARFACEPHRPPQEWFADAESIGRGTELELAAISVALHQLDQLTPDIFMAVNVSPACAITPELEALLALYPAERVVIELTEHTPVADHEILLNALDRFRNEGGRIAVDDTGAGFTSFQHLGRLRPNIIKLGIALSRDIDSDPARSALASALVTFAAEIGATTVAKGIQYPGELAALQRIGILWGQGYLLARPGPLPLPRRVLEPGQIPRH